MRIASVTAYQIYDSRGNPTIEAEMTLDGGAVGRAAVPSGASTGQFEAVELRDGDAALFRGKSVFKAIEHVNGEIARRVVGLPADDQRGLDRTMIELDGTPDKGRLGANAILAVSMAAARAAAAEKRVPLFAHLGDGDLLPLPQIQILGGGAHADWRIDVQDFLVIATGAQSYGQVMEITHNIYHAARDLMRQRGSPVAVADEGGFWPDVKSNEEALKILTAAIEKAGYKPGVQASIALDIAASDLFDAEARVYEFKLENRRFSSREFCEILSQWCARYPIVSIEDPMADTDWDGWEMFAQSQGDRVQLIGDDLFTTNVSRIRQGIARKLANAVLIKLNQIGTVSETIDAVHLTQEAGWRPIISARSGETEDAFIAHLAVATNAGQLKVGSFARSERMVKWNEVIRIERSLGKRARFIGAGILKR